MRAGVRALAVTLALTGCYPDLDGFTVEPALGRDGGSRDGGQTPLDAGGATPSGCAPEVTCTDGCPMPWLLASVEDLDGECGGQVWRFALTGDRESFCACESLTGGGEMPQLPFTVGFSPPRTVVVAQAADEVMAIDGTSDAVLWTQPYADRPIDAFAMETPGGVPLIAIGGRTTTGELRVISLFEADTGEGRIDRRLNTGDLPLGLSVSSVTQSSFNRTWFRALRSDMFAAADVDPWANERIEPPHTRARMDFFLRTVHSSYDGRFHRTVWTGQQGGVEGIFRLARADDPGNNGVPLPERCQETPGGLAYDVDCEYLHAVADPALNTSSIAICQHSGSSRRIVRVGLIGECYTLADDGALPRRVRVSRLGLAQPTFWP